MEFEAGPGFELAEYDPCPDCGVRDIDMRDPVTKGPRRPALIEWFGWSCLSCEAKELTAKEMAETYKDRHGIKVRARPYVPPSQDDGKADESDADPQQPPPSDDDAADL